MDAQASAPEGLAAGSLEERYRQACQERDYYAGLYRHAPAGYLTLAADGRIVEANLAAAAMLGLAPAELAGRELVELAVAADRAACRFYCQQLVETGQPQRGEIQLAGPAGPFFAQLVGQRQGESYGLLVFDISGRKEVEASLWASSQRFRAIADLVSDYATAFRVDPNRGVTFEWASDSFYRVTGYSPAEWKTVEEWDWLIHPDDRPQVRALIKELLGNQPRVIELRLMVKSGDVRWLRWYGRPIWSEAEGRVVQVLSVFQDITRHKEAEAALRESEARYKSLYSLVRLMCDNVPDLIWAKDMQGRFLFTNQATCEQVLKARDTAEPLGHTHTYFADRERQTHPDNPAWNTFDRLCIDSDAQVIRNRTPQRFDEYGNVDGEFLYLDVYKAPFWGESGEMIGTVGCGRIVTQEKQVEAERREAEEALRRRNHELELLNRASQVFSSSLDLEQVLDTVLAEMCIILNVAAAAYWHLQPDTGELVCQQGYGLGTETLQGWRLAPGRGITGWAALTGQTVVVADAAADPRNDPTVDRAIGLPIRAMASIPVRARGQVIGVLNVVDTAPNRFNPPEVALLELLAVTAASAIDNARLHQQTRRDAETRANLLNEVNHRVKNNLAAIVGILYAERRHAGDASQALLNELISRIEGLARVHTLLSAAEWTPLPLAELVWQVISSALPALPPGKRLELDVPASPVRVAPKQANSLALIVNELATNTIKYALAGRPAGRVTVRLGLEAGQVCLEYRDDGPGFNPAVLSQANQNVGLYLVQNLVRQELRGETTLANDGGAVVKIRFPEN